MRKFLSLAFLLLTLLCSTEAEAQTFSESVPELKVDGVDKSQIIPCPWCGDMMTMEEYAYHDCDERTSVDDDHFFFRGGPSSGSVHVYDSGDVDYSGGGSPSGNTGSGETATKDKALEEVTVNGYYQGFNPLLDLLYYLLTGGYIVGGFNDLGSLSDNGESIEGNDTTNVGWYLPSNPNKWKLYNVKELKFIPNIHLVKNLPDKFQRQKLPMECAANSIAIAAGIIDGTDPEITREAIRDIAKSNKINLNDTKNGGIPLGKIRTMLNDYCVISDDNKFNRDIVENNIDVNNPVMAVTEVEFTNKKGEYFIGAHMVTIVGYDAMYYYCAVGKDQAAAVPKSEFEIKNTTNNAMKYRLYFYNGKKGVNR